MWKSLEDIISEKTPLIGIEPSAILGFRDEYARLVDDVASLPGQAGAKVLATNTHLPSKSFSPDEIRAGNITAASFSAEAKKIKIHGHCHQKALSSIEYTFRHPEPAGKLYAHDHPLGLLRDGRFFWL